MVFSIRLCTSVCYFYVPPPLVLTSSSKPHKMQMSGQDWSTVVLSKHKPPVGAKVKNTTASDALKQGLDVTLEKKCE
jgi:hypothetical protein